MAFSKKIQPFLHSTRTAWLGVFTLTILLLAPIGLAASPIPGDLKDPKQLGSATFRFLGLPLYDAKLYTPAGAAFSWDEDFGLQLTYRKNLKQKALVESTLEEITRQGNSAPTQAQLEACFQAVSKGDSYLAVSKGPNEVDFWRNGSKTCSLTYPGAKRSFMSIFLGDNSRSASFTQQLKGQ
ncbi:MULTISPECIES: hypothetical protein [unclassified Ruegeria]|uniref:hypothetical protein n=1 Tax=unclassified Ruegeria TaxID=2625375 RepID=UPI0020C3B3E2|nr:MULTISPECIES: hypothetical protein [unclassified Ruegeria]